MATSSKKDDAPEPRRIEKHTRAALWTVTDVAEFLGLKPKGVYGLAERRVLPSIRIGGRLRFDPDDVTGWVRQNRRAR